jgi:hypothetical protein
MKPAAPSVSVARAPSPGRDRNSEPLAFNVPTATGSRAPLDAPNDYRAARAQAVERSRRLDT